MSRFARFRDWSTGMIDAMLIVPIGEWQEILDRPNIGRMAKGCLLIGIVMAWISAPPYSAEANFYTETFPSFGIIVLLTVLLYLVQIRTMYAIPVAILAINLIYVACNLAAIVVAPESFDVRAIFYSVVYYMINSIVFNQRFAWRLSLAVFVTASLCSLAWWTSPLAAMAGPHEQDELTSAVALSAGCLFTQHLVLAVRSLSLQRLADAKVRMAEMQAERQITEERLVAREQLARLNRISILEAMSSSLAHEINQPISAAMNYAIAAQRWLARPVPDVAEAVQALGGAVEEIDSVGQRVLSIRQLTSRQEREYRPTDLPALVRAQVRLVRSEFERRGIALSVSCPDPEPLRAVAACGPDLAQVVMNLLSNALEAFPANANGAMVDIAVTTPGPRWAEVRVTDNGCGIAPEDFAQVFQPFHTTKAAGTGLGLSICREIAERHAGSLVLAPAPSGGTIATLRLAIDA